MIQFTKPSTKVLFPEPVAPTSKIVFSSKTGGAFPAKFIIFLQPGINSPLAWQKNKHQIVIKIVLQGLQLRTFPNPDLRTPGQLNLLSLRLFQPFTQLGFLTLHLRRGKVFHSRFVSIITILSCWTIKHVPALYIQLVKLDIIAVNIAFS